MTAHINGFELAESVRMFTDYAIPAARCTTDQQRADFAADLIGYLTAELARLDGGREAWDRAIQATTGGEQ